MLLFVSRLTGDCAKVFLSLIVFVGLPPIVPIFVSLFFLPLVFVFVLVGVLVSVSVSVFVFVDVPLLVALFVIVGLLVLVIPEVWMFTQIISSKRLAGKVDKTHLRWWWCWVRHNSPPDQMSVAYSEAKPLLHLLLYGGGPKLKNCVRIFTLYSNSTPNFHKTHLFFPLQGVSPT